MPREKRHGRGGEQYQGNHSPSRKSWRRRLQERLGLTPDDIASLAERFHSGPHAGTHGGPNDGGNNTNLN
ncbi:MAG TPA: hypothetical protein VLB73_02525 [Patescibacteria group bacterium]|nr:hypothetical protein [Patescibacteria group bacterium]